MNSFKMNKVKIIATSVFLPDEIVKSDHLLEEINSDFNYGIPTNWLSEKVGIIERRVGLSTASPVDHALPAVNKILAESNVNPDDIGMVIFCGIEREKNISSTAELINARAGLNATYKLDVSNACFGFYEGIEIAARCLGNTGVKNALIVTGEISSHVLYQAVSDLKNKLPRRQARNIIGALTVGDAGGAMILEKSQDETGFDLFTRITVSSHTQKCIYKRTETGKFEGQMLMGSISKLIVDLQGQLVTKTMNQLRWEKHPWVISHQMGKPPFEKLRSKIGVPEENMVKTFPLLGNITSATLPANWHYLFKHHRPVKGDNILACMAGSGIIVGQFAYTI
jgi:3-oxoacyl-[acyl-carrier-protein] synthase III